MFKRALLVTFSLTFASVLAPAATLEVKGRTFTLDGRPFEMWGIRTASASQTDELTAALIRNLDTYLAHGVNTVSVYYMGSSGGYSDPFTADGSGIAPEHARRMKEIITACDRRGMVVVVGIFYQRSDRPQLRDWTAAQNAVRTVAESLRHHRNVILNIANEQNSSRYEQMRWSRVRNPADVIELCQLAKRTAPQLLVGAGGYDHAKNIVLGQSPALDTLLFDTNGPESSGDLYQRFRAAGINKPIVNVETFGAWTARFTPQGVFPDEARQAYLSEIAHAARLDGLYLHFHNNLWLQATPEQGRIRYDLGGQGTADDPGIRWYFEAVRAASRGTAGAR